MRGVNHALSFPGLYIGIRVNNRPTLSEGLGISWLPNHRKCGGAPWPTARRRICWRLRRGKEHFGGRSMEYGTGERGNVVSYYPPSQIANAWRGPADSRS